MIFSTFTDKIYIRSFNSTYAPADAFYGSRPVPKYPRRVYLIGKGDYCNPLAALLLLE